MKARHQVIFYLNDQRFEIGDEKCFWPLSDFLRYERGLVGTKVVCAEGDCGACTILSAPAHEIKSGRLIFKSVNSCILPVFALDGCHVVTVEGLKKKEELHAVQKSMLENFAAQCGYCTPGFVCAVASLVEDSSLQKKPITEKRVKNYLTGNLCRCTGYDPIIKSCLALDMSKTETLQSRYHDPKKIRDLQKVVAAPLEIAFPTQKLFMPSTLKQALLLKKKYPTARILAGATDVGVWINKGKAHYEQVISLQNISSLWKIKKSGKSLEIGARVTLASLQKAVEKSFPEFDRMLNIFASPQIKNSGTLVGNVVNASPIADTIPFLMVSGALVEVQSAQKKRLIPIENFYLGYKKLDLKPTELVTSIRLPLGKSGDISKLYKVSLRKDLDISAVTMAAFVRLRGNKISEARLAFGGVGPTVLRMSELEKSWLGLTFEKSLLDEAAEKIGQYVTPLSDVRGSKEYRLLLCRNLLRKFADEISTEASP